MTKGEDEENGKGYVRGELGIDSIGAVCEIEPGPLECKDKEELVCLGS